MDMSDKDEFAAETSNCDDGVKNFDSVNTSADWRISASNPPVSFHPENPMPICHSSCSPLQMIDSSRQNLWNDGGFNVHTDAGTSNVMASVKGNIDMPLEMGWSMAQFPADSGFTERAARFSLFGFGSFSEMMVNQQALGVPESISLFLQDTEIANGSKLGDGEPIKDASIVLKDRSNGSSNVSEDFHSSGGNGKKRKRFGKHFKADQSRRVQRSGEEQEDNKQKDEQSPNSNANKRNSGKQASDALKDGYIQMRARRGQATNSHSLAERVRREKISKRMKFLQDLVPGCDKVTGKAVMLDEIINYVQSLQCQIEFLSMKLSTVNPLLDFNLESLIAKDALHLSAPTFPQSMSMLYPPLSYLSQTGFMQPNLSSMSPSNGGLKRQGTHGYESDHHNVVHMNHGTGTATDHEDATANTKVEP